MNDDKPRDLFIGIDVGTGSARAGLFDRNGAMLASGTEDIRIWRPETDFVEQSSDDIWRAIGIAVRQTLNDAGADPAHIQGVGVDATCSLVALDVDDQPVSLSPTNRDEQNIIVWMDHRAIDQTDRINHLGHDVLKYVGSRISPEMQSPKLLWLKEHLPDAWRRAARFFDLPDFLTYRATGCDVRSLCSTVCKWTYLGHEEPDIEGSVGRWDDSYWRAIGLGDVADEQFARIGRTVRPMGESIGHGLTERAAADLGLRPGTPVSVSIIDALSLIHI